MVEKKNLRRTDLVFSIILMVLSVYFFIQCVKIFANPFGRANFAYSGEAFRKAAKTWMESPAIVPALFCFLIFICAIALFVNARKEGAKFDFLTKENVKSLVKNKETKIAIIVFSYLIIYVEALMPLSRNFLDFFPKFQGFPFMIATFIYLVAMMITFCEKERKKIIMCLIISALAAAGVTLGFGNAALIPLP
jgi:hypothetical protein